MLRIVHIANDEPAAEPVKKTRVSKKQIAIDRAKRRLDIHRYKDYRTALRKYKPEIDAIRAVDPTWFPTND